MMNDDVIWPNANVIAIGIHGSYACLALLSLSKFACRTCKFCVSYLLREVKVAQILSVLSLIHFFFVATTTALLVK